MGPKRYQKVLIRGWRVRFPRRDHVTPAAETGAGGGRKVLPRVPGESVTPPPPDLGLLAPD